MPVALEGAAAQVVSQGRGGGDAGAGGAGGGVVEALARLDGNYQVPQGALVWTVASTSGVLANDEGAPPLAVSGADTMTVSGGAVTVSGDGAFDYSPSSPGFFGLDTFGYTLSDAAGDSDQGVVRLVVVPEAAHRRRHRDQRRSLGPVAMADRSGTIASRLPPVEPPGIEPRW
jgi:hypothetical protein